MSVRKHKLAPESQKYATEHIIVACENKSLSEKDHAALDEYRTHRVLTLKNVREDSMEFIANWNDLRSLKIYSCKISDCSALARHKQLRHLWYNGNRSKEPDLSFLSSLSELEELGLGYITNIAALPKLKSCRRLKRLTIFNCKNLTDIDSVLEIPNLQSFSIVCTPHGPSDLNSIMAMPTLKTISGAFGSKAKDKLFHDLIDQYGLKYG